jgi:hypothetical protein
MASDTPSGDDIPLDKIMKARLRAETRRTGTAARELLRGQAGIPPGLTPRVVNRWLLGAVATVPESQFRFVLDLLAELPDSSAISPDGQYKPKSGRRVVASDGVWIDVTPDMAAQLKSEFARTGLKAAALLARCQDAPPGLTAVVIANWVTMRSKRANPEFWRYVIERFAAMPDRGRAAPPSGRADSPRYNLIGHEPISEAKLSELHRLRAQTGIGASRLMSGAADKPDGMTPAMVANWLSGRAKTAVPAYVDYAIDRYRVIAESRDGGE